jgi:hypothetical protein
MDICSQTMIAVIYVTGLRGSSHDDDGFENPTQYSNDMQTPGVRTGTRVQIDVDRLAVNLRRRLVSPSFYYLVRPSFYRRRRQGFAYHYNIYF